MPSPGTNLVIELILEPFRLVPLKAKLLGQYLLNPRKLDTRLHNYQFTSSQSYGWKGSFITSGLILLRFAFQRAGWSFTGSFVATLVAALLVYIPYWLFSLTHVYFFEPKLPESPEHPQIDGQTPDSLERSKSFYDGLQSYRHTPLSTEESFRLLLLKSGTDGPLECELIELSVDTLAYFDALSYTWGTQTSQRYILCEGKKLPITENCETALRSLRMRFTGRLLWVDSICIDQSNIPEKNIQLRLMGHIYSHATDVIAWLGPGTPASDIAFKYLRLYGRLLYVPKFVREKMEQYILRKIIQRGHQNLILDLATHPWFTRVWTLQETSLARPMHAMFFCGNVKISHDWINNILYELSTWLSLGSDYPLNTVLLTHPLLLRSVIRTDIVFQSKGSDLIRPASKMLMDVLSCNATDPKDKVYALYALLEKQDIHPPEPDYGKSTGLIYWETTVAILNQEHSLDLLLLLTSLDAELGNVPSWVPNLNSVSTPRNTTNGHFSATDETKPQFSISNDNQRLLTSVAIIDTILECSTIPTWQPGTSSARIEDSLLMNLEEGYQQTVYAFQTWFWIPFTQGYKTRYDKNPDRFEAFRETMLYGWEISSLPREYYLSWLDLIMCTWRTWKESTPKEFIPDLDSADPGSYLAPAKAREEDPELRKKFFDNEAIKGVTENEQWKILASAKTIPGIKDVHHHVWMMSRDCAFFVTDEGYMGTASHSIQARDVVALIPGLRMPMILRPAGGKDYYRVVAPAYVHGMMQGEIWEEWKERMQEVVLI